MTRQPLSPRATVTLPPIPFVQQRLGGMAGGPAPSAGQRLVVASPSGQSLALNVLAPTTWQVQAGSTGYDAPMGMVTDKNGNVFVTGTFGGTISFAGSNMTSKCTTLSLSPPGTSGLFVVELNSGGVCQWAQAISGSGDAAGSGIALVGNNVVVGGAFSGTLSGSASLTSAGGFDGLVVSYSNAGGPPQWVKALGGTGDDYVNAVGANGTAITIGGSFSSSVVWPNNMTSASAGDADAFVAGYQSNGTFSWVTTWGETAYDAVNAIAVSSSGGTSYVAGPFQGTMKVGGTTLTSAGGYDGAVALLGSNGAVQGAFSMGGTGDDDIVGGGMDAKAVNPCGAGYFQKSATFYKHSLMGQGPQSGFAVEYDSTGGVVWATALDASGGAVAQGCVVDTSGNTLVTGWFTGTGAQALSGLTSTGTSNVFLVKFDTKGNVLASQMMGGTGDGTGIGVALIPNTAAGVVVGSAFDATLDCPYGSQMTSVGLSDVALCEYPEP